jgi:UDP-N-acetyl-D-mannosaminuronic acid transferase (WecB/TagA/CpsF family)
MSTYTVKECEEFKGQLLKLTELINQDRYSITELVNPIIIKARMVNNMSKEYTLKAEEDKELINLMNELTIKYKDSVVLRGGSKKKSHRKTRKTRKTRRTR